MAPSFLEAVGTYAFHYFPDLQPEELRMAIMKVMPEHEERMLATAAERVYARAYSAGFAEGLAIRRAEGALLGQRRTLLRQLERRFGPVPSPTRARIEAASTEQLEDWLDRILEATDLGQLLGQLDRS
jgi:hypothetical protein